MPSGILLQRTPLRPFVVAAGGGSSLMNGLLAHWQFNEASGVRVDSKGGYDLVQTGTVGSAAGKLGNAALFDGDPANYLGRTSGLFSFDPNGQFECCLWARLSGIGITRSFMTTQTSGSNAHCNARYDNGAKFEMYVNGTQIDFTAIIPAANTWYMLSWGDDGTQSFAYVNNANKTVAARGGAVGATSVTSVRFGVNAGLGQAHSGLLDCCSLWIGRALTDAERTELYNGGAGKDYPY